MIETRTATINDAQRLLEIYGYYVKHTAISFEYEVPSVEEFRKRIGRTLERYPYFVLEEEGRVLGYAYAGPFKARAAYDWSCELSIYLDKDCRGKGYGRMLYAALEDRLKAQGIQNLYTCIAFPDVEDEYLTTNSAEFHEHMGYHRVGLFRQCAYKFGRWYSMIWMEKIVGEHPPSFSKSFSSQDGYDLLKSIALSEVL